MGDQVSVTQVDNADVQVRGLGEGGALGFLAPPRSEKPLCLVIEIRALKGARAENLLCIRLNDTGVDAPPIKSL